MKANYDMSKARRGAVIPAKGKTRITIYLDDAILDAFRQRAELEGMGYQTLINETLAASLLKDKTPVTADTLRRILREELNAA